MQQRTEKMGARKLAVTGPADSVAVGGRSRQVSSANFTRSARRQRKAARNMDQHSQAGVKSVDFLPEPNLPSGETMLSVRRSRSSFQTFPFRDVTLSAFDEAVPWRLPQYRHGQKNRPGLYWAVTEKVHVPYESLVELSTLLRLDRDPEVIHILAQPFRLSVNEPRGKSYVPDFLTVRGDGSVEVVEVKPLDKMKDPRTVATMDWARKIIDPHGWSYLLVNEPGKQFAYNLRFLAGYRRSWLFASEVLATVRANTYQPEFFGALEARMAALTGTHALILRSHLLHLLWTGELTCDLDRPIDAGSVVMSKGRLNPKKELSP